MQYLFILELLILIIRTCHPHAAILATVCAFSCSPERSGPKSGGSSRFSHLCTRFPRIRREGYPSGLRDGWESSSDPALSGPPAKCHEAWASSGLGLVESRLRCNRLKRSYARACVRAMKEGMSIFKIFKNRSIYPHQVPFRIKQMILAKQPPNRSKFNIPAVVPKIPGHLRIPQWDTSRALEYHSWVHWCDQNPYDTIAIQESGWSMTNEWTNAHWHIVHSTDRLVSILFMVRSAHSFVRTSSR